jgi:DNA-directed RNA polymerase subunit RPC12/RpoP
MKNDIQHTSHADQPCDRCGSKRFISRNWEEKMPNYSGGFTKVEYTQIKCSNKECQKEFEKKQSEELAKREVIRVKREENDAARKANALTAAKKGRTKNKSRI